MSTSYSAFAGLGIRLENEDVERITEIENLKRTVKERSCQDAEAKEDMSFCPKCGKPVWIKRQIETFYFEEWLSKIVGMEFIARSNQDNDSIVLSRKYYVSSGDLCYAPSPKSFEIPESNEIREKLKSILEPLGLYRKENFKFWLIGVCN